MIDTHVFFVPAAATANELLLFASALVGAAVFVLGCTVRNILRTEDLEQDNEWRYNVNRINELREVSPLYRLFQPLILLFANFNRRAFHDQLPEVNRQIQAAGLPRCWTAEEYLGRMQLIALLLLPLSLYFCVDMIGPSGSLLALVVAVLTTYLLRRRLASNAHYRLFLIKKRLPFLLDLLTLLMEAGSTFMQALAEAVEEFRDQPVGVEFGRVLAEISMGKSRTAALEAVRDRLSDDEITGIIGSIIQGENLGTPLAQVFRTQADVLRIKTHATGRNDCR